MISTTGIRQMTHGLPRTAPHYQYSGSELPLAFAVQRGAIRDVQHLLQLGADPDTRLSDGTPVLISAIHAHNTALAELLLAFQAAPDSRNRHGQSALQLAVQYGFDNLARQLVFRGANCNHPDTLGFTPLYAAVATHNLKLVTLLLKHGADPNHGVRVSKRPFLHQALEQGDQEIAQALIAAGAALNSRDGNGETPIFAAARSGSTAIFEYLLANGAKVEDVSPLNGKRPIHLVVRGGHLPLFNILMAHHADIHCRDFHGVTPLRELTPDQRLQVDPWVPARPHSEIAMQLLTAGVSTRDIELDGVRLGKLAQVLSLQYPEQAEQFAEAHLFRDWARCDAAHVQSILQDVETAGLPNSMQLDYFRLKLLYPDILIHNQNELVRLTRQLRNWRGFIEIDGTRATPPNGWRMHSYPPITCEALLRSYAELSHIKSDSWFRKQFGEPRDSILGKVQKELLATLGAYYSQRHSDLLAGLSGELFSKSLDKEVRFISQVIAKLPVGQEIALTGGYPNHPIYMGIRKTDPDHVTRFLYNCGDSADSHARDLSGNPFPHCVTHIPISQFENEDSAPLTYFSGMVMDKIGKSPFTMGAIYRDAHLLNGIEAGQLTSTTPCRDEDADDIVLQLANHAMENRVKNPRLFQFLLSQEAVYNKEIAHINHHIQHQLDREKDTQRMQHILAEYNRTKNLEIALNTLSYVCARRTIPLPSEHLSPVDRFATILENHTDTPMLSQWLRRESVRDLFISIATLYQSDRLHLLIDQLTAATRLHPAT